MMTSLWAFDELVAAAGGRADGIPKSAITGFSIDTRAIFPGDVFVALKDQRDGHEFVTTAFANGAVAALVKEGYTRRDGDGALIRVADTLKGLENIGRAARARLSPDARVFGVTGSVGKTTTKEMLRTACMALGPTHAADRSFNNHLGVPLTLARMPAETRYAVLEIGMNHAGEIEPLTAMVSPHVALVTTVAAAHIENFPNEEAIADAKAEIFTGLVPGGTAIINLDNRHAARLASAARACGAHTVGFANRRWTQEDLAALGCEAHAALLACGFTEVASEVTVRPARHAEPVSFLIGATGQHMVSNAVAVVAALEAAGADYVRAAGALATFGPPAGRGSRHLLRCGDGQLLLIDESYNANPASMAAALSVLPAFARDRYPRRVIVLGDMLELGPDAIRLHAGLWPPADAAGADIVFAAGPQMAHFYAQVPPNRRGAWAETARGIEADLIATLRPGDVVMIKGSNGSRMGLLVDAIKSKFGDAR